MLSDQRSIRDTDCDPLGVMLDKLAEQANLTKAEWLCLASIYCGSNHFDPLILSNLHWNVQDAAPNYFEYWEVRREDLVAKLKALDPLSGLAVALHSRFVASDS